MMQVIDCAQGTPEWFAARRGIPTASEFSTVMAKSTDGKTDGKTRRTYMLKLAGEILTGDLAEPYSNPFMERGKAMEAEARDLYAFVHDEEPLTSVGFVRSGNKGCSPDSLIGERGVLEIKTALPHILIDRLLRDGFPPEHKAQCQGALWVTEREFVDIAVYWPKLPLFIKRAPRDEEYIRNLSSEVDRFNDELAATVEKIRRYGEQAEAA